MTKPLLKIFVPLAVVLFVLLLSIVFYVRRYGLPAGLAASQPVLAQPAGPVISAMASNVAHYGDGQVPLYGKFELTFQLQTVARNLQWPYDSAPPPGIEPGRGVTVDALFTPDDWKTVYTQPAFYYQAFQEEQKAEGRWVYPLDQFQWMVRFTPNQPGTWQYKVTARDASGSTLTEAAAFIVAPTAAKGFIRVAQNDSRYFEFADGSYFPALGYNLPLPAEQDTLPLLRENGIQFVRTSLPAQLSIFGSAWGMWRSYNPLHNQGVPDARLSYDRLMITDGSQQYASPESDVYLRLSLDRQPNAEGQPANYTPCVVTGWQSAQIAVKRNTAYRIRVRFRDLNLVGPAVSGQPFGFTVKAGGVLWGEDESQRCNTPGVGAVMAATYPHPQGVWQVTPDSAVAEWQLLEGGFNSGESDFLPYLHLAIENATAGDVLVDTVWIEENFGDGSFGPNLISKPWMAQHRYFAQMGSYLFDQVLAAAEANQVYLKVVALEKSDFLFNMFNTDGTPSAMLPSPIDNTLFYSTGSAEATKTRWLLQNWWRYMQARWGYSTQIHSWELLDGGDAQNTDHYLLANEMGRYLRTAFIPRGQTVEHPHRHLVTTSVGNAFPTELWGNDRYAYIDYADIQSFARENDLRPFEAIYEVGDFYDSAAFSEKLSMTYGAMRANGVKKPVVRGKVGYVFGQDDPFASNGVDGLWLHNMIWAGVNAGGLSELYWPLSVNGVNQLYQPPQFDHRAHFKPYYNFIANLPLNNGKYQELEAEASSPTLRVWGQKDVSNGRAHLWIGNKLNTWQNAFAKQAVPAVSARIEVPGFKANATYIVEWWNAYDPNITSQMVRRDEILAQANGSLALAIDNLISDVGVKIYPQGDVLASNFSVQPTANATGVSLSVQPPIPSEAVSIAVSASQSTQNNSASSSSSTGNTGVQPAPDSSPNAAAPSAILEQPPPEPTKANAQPPPVAQAAAPPTAPLPQTPIQIQPTPLEATAPEGAVGIIGRLRATLGNLSTQSLAFLRTTLFSRLNNRFAVAIPTLLLIFLIIVIRAQINKRRSPFRQDF